MPDDLFDWLRDHDLLRNLILAALLLVAAASTVRLVNRALRKAYWRRLSRLSPRVAGDLERSKRQQTMLTVLESLIRYAVFGAAIIIAIVLLTNGAANAAFGASLLVVLVGFGFQRLLGDVVSGGLLLFEGHYGVGDFIEVHGPGVAGIVEEFSLRTTTLRALSGDRIVVLNGNITSFTNFADGYREFHLDLVVRDLDKARVQIQQVIERSLGSQHARFLLGPHIVLADAIPDSKLARVELRVVVPPTLEWLAEQSLASALKTELGDRLVGEIDVHAVREATFQAYRNSVLVSEQP